MLFLTLYQFPQIIFANRESQEVPSSLGSIVGKSTMMNLRSYSWQKHFFLKKKKMNLKGGVSQAKRGMGARMVVQNL